MHDPPELRIPWSCSPAGSFLEGPTKVCELCPLDTYRSGDATPENNVCKPVPAGECAAACLCMGAWRLANQQTSRQNRRGFASTAQRA